MTNPVSFFVAQILSKDLQTRRRLINMSIISHLHWLIVLAEMIQVEFDVCRIQIQVKYDKLIAKMI
jgi:hypothetical protein